MDTELDTAISDPAQKLNGTGRLHEAALATVLEARTIVNNLDPLGVGARDLRECLLIQIAAQRHEAEMVMGRAQSATAEGRDDLRHQLAEEKDETEKGSRMQHKSHIPTGWMC